MKASAITKLVCSLGAAAGLVIGCSSPPHDGRGDADATTGPDIQKIHAITSQFPERYYKVLDAPTVTLTPELLASNDSAVEGVQVLPPECTDRLSINSVRLVGAKVEGLNAVGRGGLISVSAQELPKSMPDHQIGGSDCSYYSFRGPDREGIAVPVDLPSLGPMVELRGTRIVSSPANGAGHPSEQYVFVGWLDGRHSVQLVAMSAPEANPPGYPIDAEFIQNVFVRAIEAVRSH